MRGADHTPPSRAEVKKSGARPPLPHMSSGHSAELIKHRDFTLTLFAHECRSLQNDLFLSGFLPKILKDFSSTICMLYPTPSFFLSKP
jgi:hypothetical protein